MPAPAPRTAIPVVPPADPLAIAAALQAVGGVVIPQLMPRTLVDRLMQDVRAACGDPEPGGTSRDMAFTEHAPGMLALLDHAPFRRVAAALVGEADLVLHRSAAVVRSAGSPAVAWHSDFDAGSGPAATVDAVLNRGEWPAGMWCYLTGCRPDHGGLWLMPGSHRPDWQPTPPYRLSADRRCILTATGSPAPVEMPGAVPVHAEPGDLVAFAARTYHAASPLQHGVRLGCALTMRPRRIRISAPWPLSPATRTWLAVLPPPARRTFEGYVGMDVTWMQAPAAP